MAPYAIDSGIGSPDPPDVDTGGVIVTIGNAGNGRSSEHRSDGAFTSYHPSRMG